MYWLNNWITKLYETFIVGDRWLMLVDGLKNTLIISLGALLIGVVLGSLIAIIKYFCDENPRMKPIKWLLDAYTTIIRGVPVVVLLLIFFFVILKSSEGVTVAVIAFGINSSAYVAEIVRSGIYAVDPGQMEAGRSLGLTSAQTNVSLLARPIRFFSRMAARVGFNPNIPTTAVITQSASGTVAA